MAYFDIEFSPNEVRLGGRFWLKVFVQGDAGVPIDGAEIRVHYEDVVKLWTMQSIPTALPDDMYAFQGSGYFIYSAGKRETPYPEGRFQIAEFEFEFIDPPSPSDSADFFTVDDDNTNITLGGSELYTHTVWQGITFDYPTQVTVNVYDHRDLQVQCPICGDWVYRDIACWTHHMETEHFAYVSWGEGNLHRFSGGGRLDGINEVYRPAYKCYGCDADFETQAELLGHLYDEHGARLYEEE
jgi:hypothetical protein